MTCCGRRTKGCATGLDVCNLTDCKGDFGITYLFLCQFAFLSVYSTPTLIVISLTFFSIHFKFQIKSKTANIIISEAFQESSWISQNFERLYFVTQRFIQYPAHLPRKCGGGGGGKWRGVGGHHFQIITSRCLLAAINIQNASLEEN